MSSPLDPHSQRDATSAPGSPIADLFTPRPAQPSETAVQGNRRQSSGGPGHGPRRRLLGVALIGCILVLATLALPRLAGSPDASREKRADPTTPVGPDAYRARELDDATRGRPNRARSRTSPSKQAGKEAEGSAARDVAPTPPPSISPPAAPAPPASLLRPPDDVAPLPPPGPTWPVPPARRAPVFPAPVPPGSPPEFL
jgi:hypothetical protein